MDYLKGFVQSFFNIMNSLLVFLLQLRPRLTRPRPRHPLSRLSHRTHQLLRICNERWRRHARIHSLSVDCASSWSNTKLFSLMAFWKIAPACSASTASPPTRTRCATTNVRTAGSLRIAFWFGHTGWPRPRWKRSCLMRRRRALLANRVDHPGWSNRSKTSFPGPCPTECCSSF